MKKIYLEKQFMKALGCDSYILGEIKAVTEKQITIKKKDGNILTVMPHAILGWEKERRQRAFHVEKLNNIKTDGLSSFYSGGKTIYLVDPYFADTITEGKITKRGKYAQVIKATVLDNGASFIGDTTIIGDGCSFSSVAQCILNMIDEEQEVELRVNTIGLGKGLMDYLVEDNISIVQYKTKDFDKAYLNLFNAIENEKLTINKEIYDMLENLDAEPIANRSPRLKQHINNPHQKSLLNCLLMLTTNINVPKEDRSKDSFKFTYYTKEVELTGSTMFFCDVYKNGKFLTNYSRCTSRGVVYDKGESLRNFLMELYHIEIEKEIDYESWNKQNI